MAEIQSQQTQQKRKGFGKGKKHPTRVDLTPMVDLGFLLITFFVFTTSLSQARVMKMNLPDDKVSTDVFMPVTEGKILNLVLADEHRVGYYYGKDVSKMQYTGYEPSGLRNIILQKQAAVAKQYGDPQQMLVLIKPSASSNYENLVKTLDEMLINNVKSYMLLDLSPEEQQITGLQ